MFVTRHRHLLILILLIAAGGLTAGLVVSSQNASRPHRANSPLPPRVLVLRGNGFGFAEFGQPAPTAIAALRAVLGAPRSGAPVDMTGNCTIDAAMEWPAVTAYFFHGAFVGYATGSLLGGPRNHGLSEVTTAAGLRIGDALTRAARLYGGFLQTSFAQGGSWFAVTPTGTLAGYLTSEVNSKNPAPRIADITAGSVGCPAMSP